MPNWNLYRTGVCLTQSAYSNKAFLIIQISIPANQECQKMKLKFLSLTIGASSTLTVSKRPKSSLATALQHTSLHHSQQPKIASVWRVEKAQQRFAFQLKKSLTATRPIMAAQVAMWTKFLLGVRDVDTSPKLASHSSERKMNVLMIISRKTCVDRRTISTR